MVNECQIGYQSLTDKQQNIVDAIRRGDTDWLRMNCSRWEIKGLSQHVSRNEQTEQMRDYLLNEREARRESL